VNITKVNNGAKLPTSQQLGSKERKRRKGWGTKYALQGHTPVTFFHHLVKFPPSHNSPLIYEFINGPIH
jgi:hypothetical protein